MSVNSKAIIVPHTKRRLTKRFSKNRLFSPIYFPVKASAAYAKPSIIYEKRINICINKALTARISFPDLDDADIKNVVTAISAIVRMKMSLFTLKKGTYAVSYTHLTLPTN